jgi:NitT/TauT family transport system substrate-binding protein
MNRLLKKFFLPVLLSILVVCLPVIVYGEEQQTLKPITLKVFLAPFLSFGPYFIAEEEGFFVEQGIHVEFVRVSEAMALQAVAPGEIDVWAGIYTAGYLNAIRRGADIRVVADKGHFAPGGCPSFGLLAGKDIAESANQADQQLMKGRRFDVLLNTFEEYFLDRLLSQVGLKPDEIEKIIVPPPAQMDALAKRRIDFMVTTEPWLTRIIRSGHGVLWRQVQEIISDFDYAFVRYGPSLLKKNPEAGRRFMVAYLQGVRQYNQGKTARNLEIMSKYTRLDKDLLREACWPQIRNDGQINPQSKLDFQDWAVAKGLLDSKMPIEKMWEPRFMEYANTVLKSKQ